MKFGRRYRLTIDMQAGGDDQIVIEYPITCAFTVKRDNGSSLNSMDIEILNLSELTRSRIFQDRFGYFGGFNGTLEYRKIKLEAGYGDQIYTIFQGNLFEAGSTRRGPDIITHINARDGGYDTQITQTFQTYKAGTTKKALIEALVGEFPNLEIAAVGDDGIKFQRPVSITGNVWDNLQKYCNGKICVDLEKVYALEDFQVVEEELVLINGDTGLLETPNRMDAFLSLTTLFEPSLTMSRSIKLESSILPQHNGVYKICAIAHNCVMSGAVGGECRTTLGLLIDGQLFGKFQQVPLAQVTAK